MEEEQLNEKHKTFDEDKDSFNQYIEHVKQDAKKAAEDVQKLINQKTKNNDEIRRLENDISSCDTEMTKVEENLNICKSNKEFLDNMAEYVGIVTDLNQPDKKREERERVRKMKQLAEEGIDKTFLTKMTINVSEVESEEEEENRLFNHFSDGKTLLSHLFTLEEKNLFLIHHVQEEEEGRELAKKRKEQSVNNAQSELDGVKESVKELKTQTQDLLDKRKALSLIEGDHKEDTGEETKVQKDEAKLMKRVQDLYKAFAWDADPSKKVLEMLGEIEQILREFIDAKYRLQSMSESVVAQGELKKEVDAIRDERKQKNLSRRLEKEKQDEQRKQEKNRRKMDKAKNRMKQKG